MINQLSKPMSLSRLLLYIFIPPFLTMILYVALSLAFHLVLPPLLLFFVSALFLLFPIQIYLILNDQGKTNGIYSLNGLFINQNQYKWWVIFLLGMLTFGFAGIMTLLLRPLEAFLFNGLSIQLYQNIPDYFDWSQLDLLASYSKTVLIITGLGYILLNGFVGPIVEELFFRGFLTKKLKMTSWLAPLLMTVLFSIYHFWLPFDFFFRVIAFFPAFYLAWKLNNIKISIVFHCLSNVFTAIIFFITIMSL